MSIQSIKTKVVFIDFPDEADAPVKSYTKKELNRMYNRGKNYISGVINRFREQFEAINYDKKRHRLNEKEVELLFQLWGKP
ncbi:MAG: hypothetical protein ACK40G_17305 [Cytophagaceae bacterium]